MSIQLEDQLNTLGQSVVSKIDSAQTRQELDDIRQNVLGKKGALTDILKGLKDVAPEDRATIGGLANTIKNNLMRGIHEKEGQLKRQEWEQEQATLRCDITLPGQRTELGAIHPIQRMTDHVLGLFQDMGFTVRTGPEIETDFYNFEALNIPETHPARDMHDTFYLNGGRLLRTHTSPAQIHEMQATEAPIKIVVPGKVFRCDADVSHSPVFNQIEGLYVDTTVSFSDLKGILTRFLHALFGEDRPIRFRPSYFPFTEPSLEVDIGWEKTAEGDIKWLEVMGAGMVHRNVFRAVNYDPDSVTGFAFGLGVDRMAMLKYGIPDIRLLYENDLRFVQQFR